MFTIKIIQSLTIRYQFHGSYGFGLVIHISLGAFGTNLSTVSMCFGEGFPRLPRIAKQFEVNGLLCGLPRMYTYIIYTYIYILSWIPNLGDSNWWLNLFFLGQQNVIVFKGRIWWCSFVALCGIFCNLRKTTLTYPNNRIRFTIWPS